MEQPWVVGTFYHKPLAAIISLLSKLQADVRTAEAEALAKLYEYIDASGVSFNKVEGFAYAKRAYVMEGDTFKAEIFTAAYDDRIAPEIYIGKYDSVLVAKGETDPNKIMIGTRGESWGDGDWFQLKDVHGGKGYLKVKESIGQHDFSGVIIIKTKKGKKAFPFNSMFEVAKPSVTVAATKMNVFYIGVDNPVSISAPVPQDKIQASGLGIRKKGNEWVVNPRQPGTGTIVVSAEIDGKKITLGKAEFRVKRIPDPKAYVGSVTGSGAIKKSTLKNLPGVFAKMENFDFDVKPVVQSFVFSTVKNGEIVEEKVNGSQFNAKCKSLIGGAGRNSKIYIEKIMVKMPDGSTREIAPVNLKVI
jgi:gliding motility-associated protein GldM